MMRAAGCLSETVSLLTPSAVVVDGCGGGGAAADAAADDVARPRIYKTSFSTRINGSWISSEVVLKHV